MDGRGQLISLLVSEGPRDLLETPEQPVPSGAGPLYGQNTMPVTYVFLRFLVATLRKSKNSLTVRKKHL